MAYTKFINKPETIGVVSNSLADVRRKETLDDLERRLKKYGKCALVRCTGFGKTWMLTSILRQYKKVLYLYPAEVIKNTVIDRHNQVEMGEEYKRENNYDESSVKNTTFMTYMGLIRLTDVELKNMSYDLIIFDEMHRIGATKTKKAIEKLFEYHPAGATKYIGATATPERSDSFDVISEFFDDVCVKQYTLHDAIQDGIEKKPYYIFCRTDIESDIKDGMKERGLDISDNGVVEVIQKKIMEGANLFNMEHIIQETLEHFRPNDTYFKFIVFYANIDNIRKNSSKVEKWFQDALGKNYSVNSLVITSASKVETENVNKLNKLSDTGEKKVDLIHCIDMLNMGYHISDLTGIIMYRGTSSSIIFNQQLGRALSTGNDRPCIVFDVVDNLHRKAVFDLVNDKGMKFRTHLDKVSDFLNSSLTVDDIMQMSDDDIKSLAEECLLNDEGISITFNSATDCNINSLRTRLVKLLEDGEPKWWKFCNQVNSQDINMTGIEASYLEFIAKAVAEPLAFRVRTSVANHYLLYCSLQSKMSNLSTVDAYNSGCLTDEEFLKFMRETVKKDDSDYPIFSSNDFREKFIDTDEVTFKHILSHWNVTIKEILDLLDVK